MRTARILLLDVNRALSRRMLRTVLTAAGVALGIAAVVTATSLARTASSQVDTRFGLASSTLLQVELPSQIPGGPVAAAQRAAELAGVSAAGFVSKLEMPDTALVTSTRAPRGVAPGTWLLADATGLQARQAVLLAGKVSDRGLGPSQGGAVALGTAIARDLDVAPGAGRDIVRIAGRPYHVAAIIQDGGEGAELTLSLVFLDSAPASIAAPRQPRLVVRTVPGSTHGVSQSLPFALWPAQPQDVLVLAAAQPGRLRSGIAGDTSRLAVLLGIITLIVAAFGIANSMLISVLERRAEIGLRRAMGASRRGIAWLFLTESAMLGVVGGFVGYAGGQILSIVVSAANGWYPIKLWYLALTPLLGMMVGVLAGVYPALKAARQEPVEALRA